MPATNFGLPTHSPTARRTQKLRIKKEGAGAPPASRAGEDSRRGYIAKFIEKRLDRLHNFTQSRAAIAKAERDYLAEQDQETAVRKKLTKS